MKLSQPICGTIIALVLVSLTLTFAAVGTTPKARGEDDYAFQQLNNPPRTQTSSRVREEMERLRERGVYGADLREMLARGTLDRNAEGALVRADRIQDPRERLAALERVLAEKIHRDNLLYQRRVLESIRWEAGKIPVSRREMEALTLRWAALNRRICELKVAGYSRSTPARRFEDNLEEAQRCLQSACETLGRLQQPCENDALASEDEEPAPPAAIDPSGGKLDESIRFYVVGAPPGARLSLRSRPFASAPAVGAVTVSGSASLYRNGTSPDASNWRNVCTVDGLCGWIEGRFVSRASALSDARQAADHYLLGLISSSVESMLDLTTGEAYEQVMAVYRQDPDGMAADYADDTVAGWRGQCAACDGGTCQALFHIKPGDGSPPHEVLFQTQRDEDGKMRVAITRDYSGEARAIFDALHPYCWR